MHVSSVDAGLWEEGINDLQLCNGRGGAGSPLVHHAPSTTHAPSPAATLDHYHAAYLHSTITITITITISILVTITITITVTVLVTSVVYHLL